MKTRTKLMNKLFSSETPQEFKDDVAEKVEEAKKDGKSELKTEEGDTLKFAAEGEDVIVKDGNEETKISENPEDKDDLVMTPVDAAEEAKIEPKDEEVTVDVNPDKSFSIKFRNFSSSRIADVTREISKVMSEGEAEEKAEDKDVTEVVDQANDLVKKVDELKGSGDVEVAKEVKAEAEELIDKAEDLEGKGHDMTELKSECATYSRISSKIIDKYYAENPEDEEWCVVGKMGDSHMTVKHKDWLTPERRKEGYKTFEMGKKKDCESYLERNKEFSDESEDEEVKGVVSEANDLAEKAEKLKDTEDVDTAEEVKEESERLLDKAESLEGKGHDVTELKSQCVTYSRMSSKIIQKYYAEHPEDENEEKSEDPDVKEVVELANEITKKVDELKETKDKGAATEIKEETKELMEKAEKLESAGHDIGDLRAMCATFSEESDAVLGETKEDEGEKKEPVEGEEGKDKPDGDGPAPVVNETKKESTETEKRGLEGGGGAPIEPTPISKLVEPRNPGIVPKINPNEEPEDKKESKVFSETAVKSTSTNQFLSTKF
jgi:hypothetical protein